MRDGLTVTRWAATALACIVLAGCQMSAAAPLSVNFRGTVTLPTSATDQFNQSFTVAGLSGLTWRGGTQYVAVMDNSNKLVFLNVSLNPDGGIHSATITGGLTIAETRDFEGIAYTDSTRNSVFLAEEDTPGVHEYRLSDGALLQSLTTPSVFANRRAGFGFESLTRHPSGLEMWAANEEALTVDGALSTPTSGTIVRLLRYGLSGNDATAGEQFAYLTQPMHGGAISGGRSGVSDLVQLPDGTVLVLERSLAASISGLFQSRIYEANFAGATDVSGMPGLIGQTYTPVTKRLLWSGSVENMEGLALGPRLSGGNRALLGIVDDGDPISVNRLVAFELVGVTIPGDVNCDGSINNFDIDAFVLAISDAAGYAASYPACNIRSADIDLDGMVNNFDVDPFVALLSGT